VSVHVSSWAWKQEIGDDGAKLVLLKLADSANDDGVAWPKRETLLSECEAGHEDTIKRRLRKLRDAGLVITVPWHDANGRQTSSMYVLPHRGMPSAEQLWAMVDQSSRKGSIGVSRELLLALEALGSFLRGGASVHPLNQTSGGDAHAPLGGASTHPSIEEPSVEPSSEELRSSSGEGHFTRNDLAAALADALGVDLAAMTKPERRKWDLAADDLVDADATPDQVRARVETACGIWSSKPGPTAIVGWWGFLGSMTIERTSGFDRWLEEHALRFGRQGAHDVIDDNTTIDDHERARRHAAVDALFDGRSEAA
jgi:Helix-turn-helix domain